MPADLATLFAAETPEARAAAAAAWADTLSVTDLVRASRFERARNGPRAPPDPRLPHRARPALPLQANLKAIEQFKTELADKGKNKANARAGALRGMKALLDKFGNAAESAVLPLLGEVLEALADKIKPVCVEAGEFNTALMNSLSKHAVMSIVPTVLEERDGKWQSNLGRAKMLKEMAEKFPKQMNRVLTSVMPVVSGLMWDTKPQVKDTAAEAMNKSARRRHAAKRAPQHNKIAHAAAPLSPLAPHFSPSSARLRV
jgi:hypothetical protein